MAQLVQDSDATKRGVSQTSGNNKSQGQPSHDGECGTLSQADPKKKLTRATERNPERVQQLRGDYWHEIIQVNEAALVFGDETGSNLAMMALCSFS